MLRSLVRTPRSYSQFGEDLILWRALRFVWRGFYIDVGAMDPEKESVTKLFYDLGWSGINIEPRPQALASFLDKRRRDINLECAIASQSSSLAITEFGECEGLSTAVPAIADSWLERGLTGRTFEVPCKTLSEVCRSAPRDIHFLKIDVEGAELDVIQSCDFTAYRPWILAIESTVPGTYIDAHEEWEPLVLGAGYEFALFHQINRYYVARERCALAPRIKPPLVTQPSISF
jgi:FkbM family methyltransferase